MTWHPLLCVCLAMVSGCAYWDDPRSAEQMLLAGQPEAAVAQLERLAQFGKIDAVLVLGDSFSTDQYGIRDRSVGEAWYRVAAEAGSGRAKLRLARSLQRRAGSGRADAAEVVRLLREAADDGEDRALGDLARHAIDNGNSPAVWIARARDAGRDSMANFYEAEWLVASSRDHDRAKLLYANAVAFEPDALTGYFQLLDSEAVDRLLSAIVSGEEHFGARPIYGLARHLERAGDIDAALRLYRLAAPERPKAWLQMTRIAVRKLEPTPENRQAVVSWLELARTSDYWIPARALAGKLHFRGDWLVNDAYAAVAALEPIAGFHAESAYLLAEIHRLGLLGSPDVARARSLATTAVALGEHKARRTLEKIDALD